MEIYNFNLLTIKNTKLDLYTKNAYLINFNTNNYIFFNNYTQLINYSPYFNYTFLYFKSFFNNIYYILFLLKYFYKKFIFLITVGLGFRKYLYRMKGRRRLGRKIKKPLIQYYIGNRHNLVYRTPPSVFVTRFKRSYFVFFSNSKKNLFLMSSSFKSGIKDSYFKLRGLFLKRTKIKRRKIIRWLFARRVRFRKLKLKLSKKQKFA